MDGGVVDEMKGGAKSSAGEDTSVWEGLAECKSVPLFRFQLLGTKG